MESRTNIAKQTPKNTGSNDKEVQKLLNTILEMQKSIVRLLYSPEIVDQEEAYERLAKELEESLKLSK